MKITKIKREEIRQIALSIKQKIRKFCIKKRIIQLSLKDWNELYTDEEKRKCREDPKERKKHAKVLLRLRL